MINRIRKSIKQHTVLNSIAIRLRFVLRINNKRIYNDYYGMKQYTRLKREFRREIEEEKNITFSSKKTETEIIWTCWLQGIENAPEIVQISINSIKKAQGNFNIIILNQENIKDYISLPSYIEDKREKGIISPAHYTDIVRTALLCKYGGLWLDATVLCISDNLPSFIVDSEFFVFQDINWGNHDKTWSVLSNWLLYSKSDNNKILLLTYKLLCQYWQKYNYTIHYNIYHMFFTMAVEKYQDIWNNMPIYSNEPPRLLDRVLNKPYS